MQISILTLPQYKARVLHLTLTSKHQLIKAIILKNKAKY